jgi:FMN phosphatase YigB (HAD superfamily)
MGHHDWESDMAEPQSVVFLVDVDNTLLDNDQVETDLRDFLTVEFGADLQDRYWQIFERLRTELGYADYLGALQRYRIEHTHARHLLEASLWLVDYPFADQLYDASLDVIEHLGSFGQVVILSDGDVVFQPLKIARSGIWSHVGGHVLIYIHKEQMLEDIERRYPSRHYVLIDDKLRILTAIKEEWQERVTTVFVRQGHYAQDEQAISSYPSADLTVDKIEDLLGPSLSPSFALLRDKARAQS